MDRIANLLNATAVAICDAQTAETSRRCGLKSSATAAILMLGQHEGQTVTDVALVAGISHSAMVRLIEGLDRQGLVTRTSGKDKRKIECALTQTGRALYRELRAAQTKVLSPLLECLSENERSVMERALSKMLTTLTKDPDIGDHICRYCDEGVCPQDRCPVEVQSRVHAAS